MMNIKYFALIIAMILLHCNATAQIAVNENAGSQVKGVVIHADPRLAVLLKKQKTSGQGGIRSAQGFRVQIYNGNDRNQANRIKIDFMQRFPNVRTYLTYVQPQFRVKVGDFRSRAEAYDLYKKVQTLYNPCMIVPDIVVINTLKDD